MFFPAFYREVPRIRMRDPLADFLGACDGGLLEYGYEDAVKLAGHSCPTVASAYTLTRRALEILFRRDEIPCRGEIAIEMQQSAGDGVAGVMAQVMGLMTGAAAEGGFKGLGGRFSRRDLFQFASDIPLAFRFRRMDNGMAVDAAADLRQVPAPPTLGELMQRCLSGEASLEEQHRFGLLWQERVRRILLEHDEDPSVFRLQKLA